MWIVPVVLVAVKCSVIPKKAHRVSSYLIQVFLSKQFICKRFVKTVTDSITSCLSRQSFLPQMDSNSTDCTSQSFFYSAVLLSSPQQLSTCCRFCPSRSWRTTRTNITSCNPRQWNKRQEMRLIGLMTSTLAAIELSSKSVAVGATKMANLHEWALIYQVRQSK